MPWIRLYLTVEGPTERAFADTVLQPHLAQFEVDLRTRVPLYDRLKVRVGAPAAAAIGLNILRANCPHFNQWVSRLERLPAAL